MQIIYKLWIIQVITLYILNEESDFDNLIPIIVGGYSIYRRYPTHSEIDWQFNVLYWSIDRLLVKCKPCWSYNSRVQIADAYYYLIPAQWLTIKDRIPRLFCKNIRSIYNPNPLIYIFVASKKWTTSQKNCYMQRSTNFFVLSSFICCDGKCDSTRCKIQIAFWNVRNHALSLDVISYCSPKLFI